MVDVALVGTEHLHVPDHLTAVTRAGARLVGVWTESGPLPDGVGPDLRTEDLAVLVRRADVVVVATATDRRPGRPRRHPRGPRPHGGGHRGSVRAVPPFTVIRGGEASGTETLPAGGGVRWRRTPAGGSATRCRP